MHKNLEYFFGERQKFRQWYVWMPLLAIFLLPLVLLCLGFYKEDRAGLIIMCATGLILIVLFSSMYLSTKLSNCGITVDLFPFTGERTIQWRDIEDISIRPYDFVGFGVRYVAKSNTIYYCVSGNMGMCITLKNGEKIVIGTRQPVKISMMLQEIQKSLSETENATLDE